MNRRSHHPPHDDSGMTLIEVMIALLLFTVGLLGMAALQGTSARNITSAQAGMVHSVAAGERLEQILSMDYDDERLNDGDRGFYPDTPDHGPFAIDASGATIEWEVEDNAPGPRLKRITVTIRWPDRAGGRQSFSYGYVKTRDLS